MTAVSVGLAMPSPTAMTARPAASSAVGSSALVSEWIAALGPADENFPKIEAALKALPITATNAQVATIVAPVAGLVKPIEALLHPVKTTALEALGAPTYSSNCSGGGYESVSGGGTVRMGGQTYDRGFELVDVRTGCVDHWTWHIGGLFQTFTAVVGIDESDTYPASVAFLGPNGKFLTFSADGQSVTVLPLVSGLPTNVTVNIAGNQNFVLVGRGTGGSSSPPAHIDVANDALSPS